MGFRNVFPICLVVLVAAAGSSFGASSVQGWMTSDGVTGQPGSTPHHWDREIVYLAPAGSGGITAGMRMLAMEPGWFFIQPPGGFPAGRYTMFTVNLGNIDGGSVGFDYEPTSIDVPGGSGAIENLQLRSHAHYSVMYNGTDYTQWSPEPWIWGTDFYQTFVANSSSVTRVATKLAGKSGDHYWMNLNFAVYRTNAGAPSTWTQISPVRDRYLAGGMDPIIHILDVNFLSSEVSLVPGQEYAVRFWLEPGSQADSFAIVARPDGGTGYPNGRAYVGDTPSDWDLYGYVTGGAPGTVVNFEPTDHEQPITDVLVGWADRQGQTFRATGHGLAAVELLYTVGCSPNPSLRVTTAVYDSVGGSQIGPAKTCYTVMDQCQGRVAAFWEPGEVPLTPGQTYYVEVDATDAGGINAWSMSNDIPDVGGYVNRVSLGSTDLPMSIAEYAGGDSPTPTPVTGSNLLRNGDMEQGPIGTSGEAPDYWTKWTGSGDPSFWHIEDFGRNGTRTARVIGGAINGTTFDAGWHQRVDGLSPGGEYGLQGWVHITPGLTSEYESWIGYDLSGQTSNGLAGTVHYTKIGGYPDFVQLSLQEFVATGSSVTVWLRARNTSTADVFYADFDDMSLVALSTPAETPTLVPTNTPVVTSTFTPTPTRRPTPAPGENLLQNGGMEQGPIGTSGEAPDYWIKWTGSGDPSFWHIEDFGRNGTRTARVIGGAINGHVFDAGWHQRVDGLSSGGEYGLQGWVHITPGLTSEYESWIGYDLSGQTSNGLAGTVHYTKIGGYPDFVQLPLQQFVATGSAVTVWLRARNTSTADLFHADFDDMSLVALSTPAETPTPVPTNTPVVTSTFTPTPTPRPTPAPGENLLQNGDMEQGPIGTHGETPDYWTKWTGGGNPTFWHIEEFGREGTRTARVIGGLINGTTFDAGWHQRVDGLTPGGEYGLQGWVHITPGLASEYESWIGYDLTGQTSNGLAGTIQYTRFGGTPGFALMPLQEFVATGSSVTVWLRGRNTSAAEVFYADFDDLMLFAISSPTPTPPPTATPVPVPAQSSLRVY